MPGAHSDDIYNRGVKYHSDLYIILKKFIYLLSQTDVFDDAHLSLLESPWCSVVHGRSLLLGPPVAWCNNSRLIFGAVASLLSIIGDGLADTSQVWQFPRSKTTDIPNEPNILLKCG